MRQAEAQATAQAEVLKQSTGELATQELRILEERIEFRFKLLQWMLGFNLALNIAILFLLLRH